MHVLSLGTWWIHITSVLEWMLAIVLIERLARLEHNPGLHSLALALLPALISAMAACTWHLYDNSEQLRSLVSLQAAMTLLGNGVMALAAWLLLQSEQRPEP